MTRPGRGWPRVRVRGTSISSASTPAFGYLLLSQLRPEHLRGCYAKKLASGRRDGKGGLSPQTVRLHHVTLHGALQLAVKDGLLSGNPADAVERPNYQAREMRALDETAVRAFLEAARPTSYYPLFYLALIYGHEALRTPSAPMGRRGHGPRPGVSLP